MKFQQRKVDFWIHSNQKNGKKSLEIGCVTYTNLQNLMTSNTSFQHLPQILVQPYQRWKVVQVTLFLLLMTWWMLKNEYALILLHGWNNVRSSLVNKLCLSFKWWWAPEIENWCNCIERYQRFDVSRIYRGEKESDQTSQRMSHDANLVPAVLFLNSAK